MEAALARGHELTLFTRGRTNPELFAEAEHLRGDRDGDLSALEGREWDAVIDPSGYVPRIVRASAELLAGAVGHYLFVSSISAYAPPYRAGFDESAPLCREVESEDVGEHYGELKAGCERVVEEVFASRSTIVRAGLIVGPHDPTGRFTYWPARVARGGEVLAPGRPERPVQFVDVRDLGDWLVRVCGERIVGAYTATGPQLPMSALLETCRRVSGSDASFTWVDDAFLVERGVGEWMELPLWLADEDFVHMLEADVSRATASGLEVRALAETVRDTLERAETVDGVGLDPEKERDLVSAAASSRS